MLAWGRCLTLNLDVSGAACERLGSSYLFGLHLNTALLIFNGAQNVHCCCGRGRVDVVYTASGRLSARGDCRPCLSSTLERQIKPPLLLPHIFSMLMENSISQELHMTDSSQCSLNQVYFYTYEKNKYR